MTNGRRRALDLALIALVFVAGLALYIRTVAPTVVTIFDDSPEFQLVTFLLGVAHPTGYPLYTILGKLFTLIPLGDVAYRVNLMSAVFAAGALAGVALLARELTGRRLPGVLAAAALAVSPVFWSQATIAEVYSLHILLLVLCMWALARWDAGRASLAPAALFLGLGLAHHRMIALFLPAVAVLLLLAWRRGRPAAWPAKAVLPAAIGLVAPLALYLYIPLLGARVGSLDGTYVNSVAGFFSHVLALAYGAFISGNPLGQSRDAGFYLALWGAQFGVAGALVGLAGLAIPWRRRRMWLATLAALLPTLAFALLYQVADVEVFLLPAFLLWALGIGMAAGRLQDLAEWLGRRQATAGGRQATEGLPYRVLAVGLGVAFLAQPALVAADAWPAADRSRDWAVHDWAIDALAQPLPQGATIVGILGEMTVLRYYQRTQGLRPDIVTVVANLEPARRQAVDAAMAAQGEAYLTRPLAGVEAAYHLETAGPLIRISERDAAAPAACAPELVPGICLAGHTTRSWTEHGVSTLRVALEWQATGEPATDVRLSLRVEGDGRLAAQHDGRPVHEAYPTTAWHAGETILDEHDLAILPGTPPGTYSLLLVAYEPATGQELARADLGPVEVAPAQGRPSAGEYGVATVDGWTWGRLALLGHTLHATEAEAGQLVPVVLLWEARRPSDGTTARIWLESDGRRWGESEWSVAAPGEPGALWREERRLALPGNLPEGDYAVRLAVAGGPLRWRTDFPWLPAGEALTLGRLRVLGRICTFDTPHYEHASGATVGPATLLGWDTAPATAQAGETLDVRLVWRAQGPADRDYAVFVHLVDSAGAIAAQHDGRPGGSSYPTQGWVAEEIVEDHHPLALPAERGRYELRAGLYDPETWERASAAGAGAAGDYVVLGEMVVE